MDRRRTAAPDQKRSRAITRWTYRPALSSSPEARGRQGLKSGIRNVTSDFSPEHGDGEDANRHAVVEKRKTCSAKEFGPSQRSAGSLAGVHRHDPVTVNWKQRGAPTRDSPSQRRHRQKKKPSRSAATRRRRRKGPRRQAAKSHARAPSVRSPEAEPGQNARAPNPTLRGTGALPPRRASCLGLRPRLRCHPRRRPRRPRSPFTLALVGRLSRCGSWR